MKLAIPTDDKSTVSSVFGRATYFAIYSAPDQEAQFQAGTGAAEHGAGTAAVGSLSQLGVSQVCCAELGPKASEAMVAAGINWTIVRAGESLEAAKAMHVWPR